MKATPSAISAQRTPGGSLTGDTGRWGLAVVIAISPAAPGRDEVDEKEHGEGDRQHHRGDDGGAGIVELLEADDDQQRRDFRDEGDVAGDEDDRAVFTHRAGEGQRE